MPDGQWYPPEWPDRIRALAAGEIVPVEPKRAATVMLLRDTPDGPAVHMLRRRTSMAFAGGAYAYPGGGVDARDSRPVGWAGPSVEEWAVRLGTDAATAQAVVCAAVRETFEESGVLLAGRTADTVLGAVGAVGVELPEAGEGSAGAVEAGEGTAGGADDGGWEADRQALVDRELAFADFLDRRGLVLRSDLLGAWARWITPEFEARRYDTWFFVAALPPGQQTRNASTEADRTVWITPADAAAGYDRGELTMMPPTISTLRDLVPYATSADAVAGAAGRDLAPVLAKAGLENGVLVLSWPGHEEFTRRVPAGGPR
ncbi:NUDIX hydrolase [Streptomyces sp. NPDC058953]|uniref:NUDIX hydrolase n=1 Tax=unclassified Streptomyces TaxID=2593676 RepID=UPI0036B3FDCD